MAISRTPVSKLGARQKLARAKSLDYIRRLGLRKAAHKLETSVATLRKWLDSRFPVEKLDLAVGLGKPGGAFSYVSGTKLDELVKKRGVRGVAMLTGVPQKEVAKLKGKNRGRVRIRRDKLDALIKKSGTKGAAEVFGAKTDAIRRAAKIPITQATTRLKKFIAKWGEDKATAFIGVAKKTLTAWTKRNIPASWEDLINQKIGRRSDQGPEQEEIEKGRTTEEISRQIKKAVEKAERWNRQTNQRRFWISKKNAEKWARLGTFDDKLNAARAAYQAAKAPPPKRKPKPKRPPRRAPPRPTIPPVALPPGGLAPEREPSPPPPSDTGEEPPDLTPPPSEEPPEKPPKPPKPPKQEPTPSGDLPDEFRQEFLQARAEAFFEGRYPKPQAAWNFFRKWRLIYRHGVSVYRQIEKFVRDTDLDKLGTEVVTQAKKLWVKLVTTTSTLMTIRFVIAVMGEGNPFYPDAFIQSNRVNFVTRTLKIVNEYDIESDVRAVMEEIYVVDNENPLFFEYIQVTKSNNNAHG